MAQLINILIIGNNKPIMETIARLIDTNGKWVATIASSVEDACDLCLTKDFKLALIGAGLSDEAEIGMKLQLQELRPNLPIVKHYGGGSGLLFAEIYQAIGNS